ncbi:MAG: hypothetical protein HY881_03230 [Deltaproteobacteria bacterium]|nr:hypothetical protein [Deltaproteobacteria bacterium]
MDMNRQTMRECSRLVPLAADFCVVPPHMRIFVLILALLFLTSACSEDGTHRRASVVHPILRMEVVEIPSEGKVCWLQGDAEIKKKEINKYRKIEIGTIVGEDDILRLKRGCVTRIEFGDGSQIINEPQDKDIYITFEFVKTNNVPK